MTRHSSSVLLNKLIESAKNSARNWRHDSQEEHADDNVLLEDDSVIAELDQRNKSTVRESKLFSNSISSGPETAQPSMNLAPSSSPRISRNLKISP